MRLSDWGHPKREIEFDTRTGSATVTRLAAPRPEDAPLHGFAAIERALFGEPVAFAVYRSGDALYFHAGARRWRLGAPGLAFIHERPYPFVSRFRVIESGETVLSFSYAHLGRLLRALIDPTYDGIDEDMDFFLEFLAENAGARSWRRGVMSIWQSWPARPADRR